MSQNVKLTTAMPGDEEWNGLETDAKILREHPEGIRYALIAYDAKDIVLDTDTGATTVRVRIRQWEPLGDRSELQDAVMQAMFKAQEARTGKRSLPFDEAQEKAEAPTSEADV